MLKKELDFGKILVLYLFTVAISILLVSVLFAIVSDRVSRKFKNLKPKTAHGNIRKST